MCEVVANGGVEWEQVARGKESVKGGVTLVCRSKAMVTIRTDDKTVCTGRR